MFLFQIKDAEATLEPRIHRSLAESLELAEQSLSEVRTLSYLLHPLSWKKWGWHPPWGGTLKALASGAGSTSR
jgi:phytoene dehydrogenase-like protein